MSLMLYANLYAIARMEHYAVQAYFYQRLSVAYDIGQMPAVKQQLNKIKLEKSNKRQKQFAEKFETGIGSINDPGVYLSNMLERQKAGFERVKLFREIAFVLLMILIFIQVLVERKPF